MRAATVELGAGKWRSGRLVLARTFIGRLRGLFLRPHHLGLLLPGRSVHTLFFRRSLWAVGLGEGGQVLAVRPLRPFRFTSFSSAAWVLELPFERQPPEVGQVLRWLASPANGPDSSVAP